MTRYNGIVKCYKGKQHFGFISCSTFNEGDLFFSPGNMNIFLPGTDRMRITKVGTIVNFNIIHKRRGYQADDIKLGRYDESNSLSSLLSRYNSFHTFNPVPLSISNPIPLLSFESQVYIPGFEEINCSICLEVLDCGDSVIRLPCTHLFHENCITDWLKTSKSCPNCRQTFSL